jgi:hypothetical protein
LTTSLSLQRHFASTGKKGPSGGRAQGVMYGAIGMKDAGKEPSEWTTDVVRRVDCVTRADMRLLASVVGSVVEWLARDHQLSKSSPETVRATGPGLLSCHASS